MSATKRQRTVLLHRNLRSPYSQRRRLHAARSRPSTLTVPVPIPVIHIASASATSAIAPRLVVIRAEPGRKSAMKPSLNARTVTAAALHAPAMVRSLLKLKRARTPMVAPRCPCNQRYKMRRPYSHPCHSQQMVLVMIIGVAYRQLQRHRILTIASLLLHQVQPISDILKAVIIGETPHGSIIETRIALMVPTIPLHQWTTTSRCSLLPTLSLDNQTIHGGIPHIPHISLVLAHP